MSTIKGKMAFLQDKRLWRPTAVLVAVIPLTLLLIYWCHVSNSLALTSFTYLAMFNIGNVLVCVVTVIVSNQRPTASYSYGYQRVCVLAVFSLTVVLILGALSLLRHSLERLLDPPVISTDSLLYGLVVGVAIHFAVQYFIDNKPMANATQDATANWLQNALSDLGHSVCGLSPTLGHLLLHRIDPVTLLATGCSLSLLVSKFLIELDDVHLADVTAALFNSALMCGTMLPLSMYTGKILLQSAPEHILPLLDKSLREASTLDGVLEIKNEHFWSIAFGIYAGSLHVRVRRDANEQDVLAKVTSCLSSHLNDLTIQVVKDDWSLPMTGLARQYPVAPPTTSTTTPSDHTHHHHHHHTNT